MVRKKYLKLGPPSLEDQRDDVTRIIDASGLNNITIPLKVRRKIPGVLRRSEYSATIVYSDSILIDVEEGNTEEENYGIAVDIGTTTVVAHLLNMNTGETTDTVSAVNRQKTSGADVISRIEYCIRKENGLTELNEKILNQIGEFALSLVERSGIRKDSVYSVMAAGNTTMLHLLSGIDPEGIASAPFIPGSLKATEYTALELGNFPLDSVFFTIPSISAYVGADITAGILNTRMHERNEMSLLIDIGTNGEIVLGNKEVLYCCSTAAGPAFEGAHITCGTGGISGAIDTITMEGNEIRYTTIGDEKPAGICGSGIVDAVAVLLKSGAADFTGRFIGAEEAEKPLTKEIMDKYFQQGKSDSLVLVNAEDSATGDNIIFTQKDIREVQLAKAAISAGIATLIHEAGISEDDIQHVFIAGGFGSYISKESAAAIGLIPSGLLDRTESSGNTSGQGASICLLSRKEYLSCEDIISLTKYIELSSNSFFQTKYMEDMIFPDYQ